MMKGQDFDLASTLQKLPQKIVRIACDVENQVRFLVNFRIWKSSVVYPDQVSLRFDVLNTLIKFGETNGICMRHGGFPRTHTIKSIPFYRISWQPLKALITVEGMPGHAFPSRGKLRRHSVFLGNTRRRCPASGGPCRTDEWWKSLSIDRDLRASLLSNNCRRETNRTASNDTNIPGTDW